MSSDQHDLVQQLIHTAGTWAGPMPVDLPHFEPLTHRLPGVFHSTIVELEGYGGVHPHRLSPKGKPDLDLLDGDWSMRSFPLDDEDRVMLPAEGVALMEEVGRAHDKAIASPTPILADVVAAFLADVLRAVEDGFELVPQFFDEDGVHVGEGVDIAPGLTAAFEAAR
jgi:hypothetical protein